MSFPGKRQTRTSVVFVTSHLIMKEVLSIHLNCHTPLKEQIPKEEWKKVNILKKAFTL